MNLDPESRRALERLQKRLAAEEAKRLLARFPDKPNEAPKKLTTWNRIKNGLKAYWGLVVNE